MRYKKYQNIYCLDLETQATEVHHQHGLSPSRGAPSTRRLARFHGPWDAATALTLQTAVTAVTKICHIFHEGLKKCQLQ